MAVATGSPDGWFGTYREVLHFLAVVDADKDDQDRPIVRGRVTLFLGIEQPENDVVIAGDATYFIDGQPKNLAAGLRLTSYGLAVKVY